MNVAAYREYLLHNIPTASSASGGKVVHCRCFHCPDSRDPRSKHMYISIPQAANEPSLYYCHKCHSKGIVTYKKLIEWGLLLDDNITMDLISHNEKCKNNMAYRALLTNVHYNVHNILTSDNDISRIKLDYINNRIGTNLDYNQLRNLKIVLNLYDLVKVNRITRFTRDKNIVDQLDINFIGFLSIDNGFLNMRRICDEGLVYKSIDKRYINYQLFDKENTSERFYTIPTAINVCSPERIKIHIAEGPFDILSIYLNLRHQEPGIYTSIGGSNYKGIAMYFLEQYKLPYVEFHFYPDNDKYGSTNNIQRIADYFKPLNIPSYIHRNTYPGEKDFGTDISKITESIMIL